MKLGMQLGYDDPIGSVAMAQEANRLGFHSVWTSEAWGADAVTVASWIAATSEPQVVEGWHGVAWGKPLGRTREYVEIVRAALQRQTLEHHGEHYDIPYTGAG